MQFQRWGGGGKARSSEPRCPLCCLRAVSATCWQRLAERDAKDGQEFIQNRAKSVRSLILERIHWLAERELRERVCACGGEGLVCAPCIRRCPRRLEKVLGLLKLGFQLVVTVWCKCWELNSGRAASPLSGWAISPISQQLPLGWLKLLKPLLPRFLSYVYKPQPCALTSQVTFKTFHLWQGKVGFFIFIIIILLFLFYARHRRIIYNYGVYLNLHF